MKLLKKLNKNIAVASKKVLRFVTRNITELYVMSLLFVALPCVVWALVGLAWGLLVSFVLQSVVGILYIRGKA